MRTTENHTGHPLYPILIAALEQAMYGKGERHGGNATPFLEQPMFHYIKMHGRGFATGQAAKKLEEAASTRQGAAFEQEVLGAIVYAASAILSERMKDEKDKQMSLSCPPEKPFVAQASVYGEKRRSIDDATPAEWAAAARASAGY
jgi:hypothetical protein